MTEEHTTPGREVVKHGASEIILVYHDGSLGEKPYWYVMARREENHVLVDATYTDRCRFQAWDEALEAGRKLADMLNWVKAETQESMSEIEMHLAVAGDGGTVQVEGAAVQPQEAPEEDMDAVLAAIQP